MLTLEIKASDLPVPLREFRLKALAWANIFRFAAYYTFNQITYPHRGFEEMLAVSAGEPLSLDKAAVLLSLRTWLQEKGKLLCGFLSYDVKNELENLRSDNPDFVGFPLALFFQPEVVIYFKEEGLVIIESEQTPPEAVLQLILHCPSPEVHRKTKVSIQQRVRLEEYRPTVERIKQHILEGDVYELNYCIEFFAEKAAISPLSLFLALNEASPTPFAGYLKADDKYLLCASPERFLKKEGRKLISQPIKGTIRRGATPEEDVQLQHQLRHDEKELAENMMIVDLVRNDLRRSCATGTVQVEEMFGIYGFRHVSQMISTVSGELQPDKDLVDALKGAFPMGSMTGAPKIRAMQMIEELESTRRGLYSGTFGYISPTQDCDFNVVIRSIQYNAATGYLSFMVGSAITYDSDPEKEYQECLLKAKAILQVLGQ